MQGARERKTAFTLAEVLITLGVIGIVAAMTLPGVTANWRKKALEASFKKSYSNFYNAYNKAMINEPPLWDYVNTVNPYPELAKAIYAEYIAIKHVKTSESQKYTKNVRTYTLKKGAIPESSQLFRNTGSVITPDGSAISVSQNSGRVNVIIDTNGIVKGPNAYGHDIFQFQITRAGKFMPATSEAEANYDEDGNRTGGYNTDKNAKNKCSKNSTSLVNGITCANYALQDKCPDDPNKGYWECLP